MTKISLTQLYNIATEYNFALQDEMLNVETVKKYMDYLSTSEGQAFGEKIVEVCAAYWNSMTPDIYEAVGHRQSLAVVSESFARAALQFTELHASVAFNAGMDKNLLSGLVKRENRSAAVSQAFLANGAPVLAKLFAPETP